MRYLRSLKAHIKRQPFLSALLLILAAIAVVSIKPGFYLMGWDNYSTYFNLKTTLWKTLFHSWREFRGLGVPSDSEIADLPRQLFFLVFSLILPETMLDQLYWIVALFIGVLAIYLLAVALLSSHERTHQHRELGGFIAACFYLFNLNTLSVYFFPITPYISRYFAIPLLILGFYSIFTTKLAWKKTVFWLLVVFFTAPSYVIGTVYMTILIMLGIFNLFQGNLKKSVIVTALFILLNSFWLLPFFNYTIQKSSIIKSAPTFISANETQLNKGKSFYDITHQLILLPNFFETQVTSIEQNKTTFLHPLASAYNTFPYYPILLLFPILYILGSILLVVRYKENKTLLWIPSTIFVFLFFSLKEYSPLGFLYHWFSLHVPYFEVIFRFGDTKFHPFIAFAGALAAMVALLQIITWFSKYRSNLVRYAFPVLILIATVFVFRSYFNGNLIGFYMYNKIPNAYRQIAETINQDPDQFRVVHLPYDDEVYWRSYTWGYLGSSFFNFLIDKPIFEKTFEPASMENAYVNEKIQRLLDNTQSLSADALDERSDQFYGLLSELGVKYIILDGTVSAAQPSRGVVYWGHFNQPDTQRILDSLVSRNYVDKVSDNEISPAEYMKQYAKQLPISDEALQKITQSPPEKITLYRLHNVAAKVQFLPNVAYTDPKLNQQLLNQEYIQETNTATKNSDYTIYPFLLKNSQIGFTKGAYTISLDSPAGSYEITAQSDIKKPTYLIESTGKIENDSVVISTYAHYFPTIDGYVFRTKLQELKVPRKALEKALQTVSHQNLFISDWSQVAAPFTTDLRLQINQNILPIPPLTTAETSIGYTIVSNPTVSLNLLAKDSQILIPKENLKLTDIRNCYKDALSNYSGNLTNDIEGIHIQSQNGSTCFWQDIQQALNKNTASLEFELTLNGKSTDLDQEPAQSSKPNLTKTITQLNKPSTLQICIKEYNTDNCFNTHQLIQVPSDTTKIRIPTTEAIKDISDLLIFFALKNTQYQKNNLNIYGMAIDTYQSVGATSFTLTPPEVLSEKITLQGETKITIPHTLSAYSYVNDKHDALFTSNQPCEEDGTYRTYRSYQDTLISYVQKCQSQLFATVPFSSNNFSLWLVNYNLASGKFPSLKLADGLHSYKNEYASLYLGYPDIPEFKTLQGPEELFQGYSADPLKGLEFKNTYTYIYPHTEYGDEKMKNYTFEQFSENEGIMAVRGFNVVELPNYWPSLKIVPTKKSETEFAVPNGLKYSSILPSLKQISVQASSNNQASLLKLNEGYDKQWGVYDSLVSALLNKKIKTEHYKCDGYANCFVISGETLENHSSLYLYYWPETLNLLGWILTALGVTITLRLSRQR